MFRWKSVTQTHFRIWLAETSQTTWWKHTPRLLARGNGHLYVVIIIWSTLLQLQMVSIIIVLLFIAWRTRSGSMSSGTLPDIQYSCFINNSKLSAFSCSAVLCCVHHSWKYDWTVHRYGGFSLGARGSQLLSHKDEIDVAIAHLRKRFHLERVRNSIPYFVTHYTHLQ